MKRFIPCCLLLGLSVLAHARAQSVITNTTPSAFIPILKSAGYTATLDKTGRDPALVISHRGYHARLYFTDCVTTTCRMINASDGFDLKNGLSLKAANDWNNENYSMVDLDKEGDPYIESSYILAGGVTKANFLTWLKGYLDDLVSFANSLPDDSDSDTPRT